MRSSQVWRRWLDRLQGGLDQLLETRWPRLWLVAWCAVLFLPGLFSIQPLDVGETRIAVATREMLDGGDLLRVRPGQTDRGDGPIGIHWVQAALVRGLEALHLAHRAGIPAYRLASALGGLLAVLATYHWGRGLVGCRAAFLGAVMLAGSAALVTAAHLATADALLLAGVTASMGLLASACLNPARFTAGQAMAFWLLVAAGVLLGGAVAVLLPLLAGAVLAVTDRAATDRAVLDRAVADRGRPWLCALRPARGVMLLLLTVLPWFVAIGMATEGRAPAPLLGGDLLGHLLGPTRQDWTLGLQLLRFPATAFPAAWIVLLALPGAWQARRSPAVRVLIAWAASAWVLGEVTAGWPHAILPAFPPLMLLGARWALTRHRVPPPVWLLTLGGLLLAAVAGAIGVNALGVAELDIREAPYGILAIVAALLLTWRVLAHGRSGAWVRAAMLGTMLAAPLYAAVLQGTLSHLPIGRIADRIAGAAQRVAPGLPPEQFGVLGFEGASLLFAYGSGLHRFGSSQDAAGFLADKPGRVVAIADQQEGAFRRAAAARGIEVQERTTILSFDPYHWDFGIMILYSAR